MPRKRKKGLDSEDQLFFGVVFALLLFFLTIPSLSDLSLFLQENTTMPESFALQVSITIKATILVALILSCIFRYYGTVTASGLHRYLSVEFLIAGSLFSIMWIVHSIFYSLMIGHQSVILLALGEVFMMLITFFMMIAEEGIIHFYIRLGQMKFYPPIVTLTFLLTTSTSLISSIYGIFPELYTFGGGIVRFLISIFRIALLTSILFLFIRRWKRKKLLFWS